MGEMPEEDGNMKTCMTCKENPALDGGLCPRCHEDAVDFRRSPEGVVFRIIWRILHAAGEGGLKYKQSTAIGLKILQMIQNTERTLCWCPDYDGASIVDGVCSDVIEHIEEMIGEFRKHGCAGAAD